jgi:uncharacterized protein YyaL (SSP411 family)
MIASRQLAEQRLMSNVKDNGGFVYRYDPVTDKAPDTNNEIRQMMASRLLAEMSTENADLLPLHTKNMGYLMGRYYKTSGDVARIEYSRKSKLGGMAMAIRTFVASPFFTEYADEASKLAETILRLQQPDGSFRAWWIEPDYAYDEDYLLTFYSGEAILALLELYSKTLDERRLDAARRAQDFYLVRYVDEIDQRYYPAYVPRHTMSLWYLYQITEEERYAQAVFTLNDKLIDEMLDRSIYTGRFYNPDFSQYGSPHSSSDAVYTEGVAYAYGLARQLDDALRSEKYVDALELAVNNLTLLQYTEQSIPASVLTWKVLWAIRTNTDNPEIRVDTTQHMIDAFRAIERFVLQ